MQEMLQRCTLAGDTDTDTDTDTDIDTDTDTDADINTDTMPQRGTLAGDAFSHTLTYCLILLMPVHPKFRQQPPWRRQYIHII